MKHLLFTVHDVKAEIYMAPFFVPTVGLATRAFKDCINSKEHQFGKHPADYTLFQVGAFDDQDGSTEPSPPKSLGNGVEFLDAQHTNSFEAFENDAPNPPIQPDKNG